MPMIFSFLFVYITFSSLGFIFTGQRDKPFVRDDEYDVRTPRPDLFDKNYAPDFAGETFRKVNHSTVLVFRGKLI